MSYKSVLQIFVLILILIILSSIYFVYFSNPKEIIKDDDNKITSLNDNKKNQENLETTEKNIKEIVEISKNDNQKEILITEEKNTKTENIVNNNSESKKEDNFLSEVEYLTTDNKGNKYQIFAKSGKTNSENKDVLDLNRVRGKVFSDFRSTIYIVSDFAKYNSVDLNSKFYDNVVINFEDKQINCDIFIINMSSDIAEAYGNVIVTDPKSTMYAGIITLDLETKDININPEIKKKVKVITE